MKAVVVTIVIVFTCFLTAFPQDTVSKSPVATINGDTLAILEVRPVVIFPPVVHKSKREGVRYDRLVYNVKKVYPYAKLAGQKLREYEQIIDTIPTEKARKQYLKKAQKELEDQFGDEIRDLTFSQGKILIKLVYRETGNSTYEIVKELRGGFTAFVFQTLATIFGYNLKTDYDPAGADHAIEQIVLMIEAGAL